MSNQVAEIVRLISCLQVRDLAELRHELAKLGLDPPSAGVRQPRDPRRPRPTAPRSSGATIETFDE